MELRPDDISIYKWIGDLLYEGESYRDALKAYSELGDLPTCDLDIMRCKCLLRVGSLLEVMQLLKAMENKENNDKSKW